MWWMVAYLAVGFLALGAAKGRIVAEVDSDGLQRFERSLIAGLLAIIVVVGWWLAIPVGVVWLLGRVVLGGER